MKQILSLFAIVSAFVATAQTTVNVASYTYNGGVYPTYSVVFTGTDAAAVEKWFKEQLKPISADMGGKKEVMSIGTRLPEVSSDTIRVFVKADQQKKSTDLTLHVAFRVNNTFIGPDSDERQREGCRSWVYQKAVMLKKNIAQKELDAATKQQITLESELAGLVKEKGRAEGTIEKTQGNITEDEKDKVDTEAALTTIAGTIETKKQEVAAAPSEDNSKALSGLMKDQDKLKRKNEKLTQSITDGKRKIEDLQVRIQQNVTDQDTKTKAIEAQKKLVEDLRTKLAGIN